MAQLNTCAVPGPTKLGRVFFSVACRVMQHIWPTIACEKRSISHLNYVIRSTCQCIKSGIFQSERIETVFHPSPVLTVACVDVA